MRNQYCLAGIVVLAGVAAAGWFWSGAPSRPAGTIHVADLSRGEAIYADACASCHGADLQGQPDWHSPGPDGCLPAPPHDGAGHTWHYADRVLLDISMRGTAATVGVGYESKMPGFGDVYAEDELRDVLNWIKTQWPERERARQAQVTA